MSTCGSSAFPLPCPLTPPTDGIGGSCYTVPFAIPICPTHNYTAHNTNNSSANGSDSTTAILTQYATFEVLDAAFYRPRAATLLVASMGLAISVLTLANVIVLTPGRKMGRPIHTAVVVGLIAEIVSNGCGVYLSTAGAQVSSYLVLTGDWSSTTWSVAHRGAMTAQLLAAVVAFSAVQVAFAVQGGAMCAWVRVRWGLASYHFVIGVLVVVGAVAWVFTVAFMGYQIRWVAFVGLGPGIEEYLPAVYQRSWWLWLSGGYRVSGCLSLGLWSVCFAVGAGFVLWQRRDVVFTLDSAGGEQSEGTMAGLMGRRKRVRTAYESTLRLIGVVAVESFAVPIVLCIHSVVPRRIALWESLILPVILALLPMSTLYLNNEAPTGPNQQTTVSRNGARARYGSRERLPQISQASDNQANGTFHVSAELHKTSMKPSDFDSKSSNGRHLHQGNFDRELQAIDRM